jgi:hypothetical protein
MPRPKPKKAQPNFMAHPHLLSKAAKAKLAESLGFGEFDFLEESLRHQLPGMKISKSEPGAPILLEHSPDPNISTGTLDLGKVILEVETWLGFCVDGSHHLDEIPRPADYVAAFKPIHLAAINLLKKLGGLSGYYRGQFKAKDADIYVIESGLATLLEVSNAVLKNMARRPSKGARKNTALAEVIRQLRRIFRDNYQGQRTGRTRRGAFQFRAEEEKRELAFVRTALLDARIIREGYRELPRLFRDPRCQPPIRGEPHRAAEIERIAKKVDRARTREQEKDDH